ncbi:hypothetical protein [Mycolicibacterium holsaticum]|uniref:PE-PPE domain-containing protein n=1 Tax=Mycolicibacterium holsaticum TaxID=152142 RepID=A0A1E3S1P7_9MYCO|nr:hypothetical protein [Mycolicibacterium holsaticum]ODQ96030.1 hypothetical protein BHQ17_02655 [Mycolicibacterium holsaticum]
MAFTAATATATALVGMAPSPESHGPRTTVHHVDTELLAAVNRWPSPGQIADATAGLGAFGYDITQTVVDFVARAVVENFNLGALAGAGGKDFGSLVADALGDPDVVLNNVLGRLVGEIPIDLLPVLNELVGEDVTDTILLPVLRALGVTDAQGTTDLVTLLRLVGLDFSDLFNLGGLDISGVNLVTASPVFTMLKLLGADLGWAPSLPNSVAHDINRTDYLRVPSAGLFLTLLNELGKKLPDDPLIPLLKVVIVGLGDLLPDIVNLRVPTAVGIGMGAFAIATGYDKVLADLANQPGGAKYGGIDPFLGSFTVLPMLLLFNPARPNGGAIARFYPLFGALGIDTVNPRTTATSSGGLAQLPLGLSLGGANLIPVLIDIGVQYHPLSDFAAWPNPFSLANNLMAGLLPTYMLRGLTLDTVAGQIRGQLGDTVDVANGELALNLYVTLSSVTQPLLEPLYLISDVISILTFGLLAVNPVLALANALAPAVQALNNLGYTDVVRNPDGTYTRTLSEGGVPTPFLSFPSHIDPLQVTFDIANLLIRGFHKEFFSGHPTPPPPNAILNLFENLTGKDLPGGLPLRDLGNRLGDAVGDVLNDVVSAANLPGLAQQSTSTDEPTESSPGDDRLSTLSTDDETDFDARDSEDPEPAEELVDEDVDEDPEEGVEQEEPLEEEDAAVDDEEPVDAADVEAAGEDESDDSTDPADSADDSGVSTGQESDTAAAAS